MLLKSNLEKIYAANAKQLQETSYIWFVSKEALESSIKELIGIIA